MPQTECHYWTIILDLAYYYDLHRKLNTRYTYYKHSPQLQTRVDLQTNNNKSKQLTVNTVEQHGVYHLTYWYRNK